VGDSCRGSSDLGMFANFRNALWLIAAVAVVAGLVAPKLLPLLHVSAAPNSTPAGATQRGGSSLRVTAVTLQPTRLAEKITATGTLLADEGVELQAETNGKIAAILFTEGALVRKGDLLVKLNNADLQATYARAKYREQLAALRERRLAQLVRQGVARQEEYDTALNELNVQRAEIELTQAQIAKTEIRAPFDGVVGLRYVSEGAYVNAATRIATLQRIDRLKVDFSVAEKYAARIRPGRPIEFTVAGAKQSVRGQIYALDPRIDTATRTVLIRAICPNGTARLLPGAFANIEVTLDEIDDALLVPSVAVIPGLHEKNVFVVRDGKAERRAVEVGTRTAGSVHILSGLAPGDIVITSGLQQLREGQRVVVGEDAPT
jgi:membrane fusion protein (multidrug efflux system)